MPVVAYASLADLAAYSPNLTATEAERERALNEGARDIDRFMGLLPRSSTAPAPLKYDVTLLDAESVEGLMRANCAQAEYRLTMGDDFFIHPHGTVTEGPDFTITTGGGGGSVQKVSPKAMMELRAYGLIRVTARARP